MTIKLKVSEEEKYSNDGQWFKDYMNWVCGGHSFTIEDYGTLKSLYNVVNMDLKDFQDQIKNFCSPLGELDIKHDELVAYPDLKNKINILKGELINKKDDFHLQLISNFAKDEKTKELLQNIQQSIDEKVGLMLYGMEEQMKGLSEEEVNQQIQQLRTQNEPEDLSAVNYLSSMEILFNKLLKSTYFTEDIKSKQAGTIEDAAIADRFFIYNGWKNGKPYIEVRNPLHVKFFKDQNDEYTHYGPWVAYKQPITIASAITAYNLSEKDIEKLAQYTALSKKNMAIGGNGELAYDHSLDPLYENAIHSSYDKTTGLAQHPHRRGLIWETHFEFIGFKKVLFLSYYNQNGKRVTELHSDKFQIPKDAVKESFLNDFHQMSYRNVWFDKVLNTEFQAEEIWVPRKYEIVRLGSDVYPYYREVPFQSVNLEDPYNVSLSTKGVLLNARNSESLSLVRQALPIYFNLLYAKYVQVKELSKYQGFIHSVDVDQIPDSLGLDDKGNKIRDKLVTYFAFLQKTNRDLYSGTQTTTGGLPPSTRSPGSGGFQLGTAMELLNLQQLVDLLKRELSFAMGISPQRESNYTAGSNVADNQQAVIQSYTITEPLFFKHSMVWKDVIEDHLKALRYYLEFQMDTLNRDDFSWEVWLGPTTKEVLKVTRKDLSHSDFGLFLTASSANEKYAELMTQFSHAFAQNQGEGMTAVSQLIKDIVQGNSPEDVHKRIVLLEQEQHQRQQQLQQQQSDSQMQLQQQQIEARKEERQFELDKIKLEKELDFQTKKMVAEITHDQEPDYNELDVAKLELSAQQVGMQREALDHKKEMDKAKVLQKSKSSKKA